MINYARQAKSLRFYSRTYIYFTLLDLYPTISHYTVSHHITLFPSRLTVLFHPFLPTLSFLNYLISTNVYEGNDSNNINMCQDLGPP